MKIKSFLVGFCATFISFYAQSNPFCDDHLKFGAPSQPNEHNILVCKEGFALIFNTQTKTPLWVAEHVKVENLFGEAERELKFIPEPSIPASYQANIHDYLRTGYDQGHMAPAADFSKRQDLMDQTFIFANVVPQIADNNRHIWATLEKKVRGWVAKRQDLYVFTGPVFANHQVNKTLGSSHVAVPDEIYKIIYDPKTQYSISFKVPNLAIPAKDLPNYIVNIATVEQATGLNFLNQTPASIQSKLKTTTSGMWKK